MPSQEPKTQAEIQKTIDEHHRKEHDIFLHALFTSLNTKTQGFKKSARVLFPPLGAQVTRLLLCDLADANPTSVKSALLSRVGIYTNSPSNGEEDCHERHLLDTHAMVLEIFDADGYPPREGPGKGLLIDFRSIYGTAAS